MNSVLGRVWTKTHSSFLIRPFGAGNGCSRRISLSAILHNESEQKLVPSPPIRMVPRTHDEAKAAMNETCNFPDQRALKVAIVGDPNVGKSTLTNKLMGWRICSISKKVHTTTRNTAAVLLDKNVQMILLDTPGLVDAKERERHKLKRNMEDDPKIAIANADVVIVMVDASNRWTRSRLDRTLSSLLREHGKLSVLVLNKVDLVKRKDTLLEVTDALTAGVVDGDSPVRLTSGGKSKPSVDAILERTENRRVRRPKAGSSGHGYRLFSRVFMIAAVDGSGVQDLREYLTGLARPGRWQCPPSVVTDQSPQEIGAMAVREKLLDNLPQEIPYNAKVNIETWDVDAAGTLRTVVSVILPKKHHVRLLLGPGGKKIGQMADEARQELQDTFKCVVSLKIIVKSSEDPK